MKLNSGNPLFSIFFHNYYGKDEEWIAFFNRNIPSPFNLFFNGVLDSYHRIKMIATAELPQNAQKQVASEFQLFTESSNIGKDIGGKMILMDAYLRLDRHSEFIMLLHDKQSPYHHNKDKWATQLLRIVEPESLKAIVEIFSANPSVGIVAIKETIHNELDNTRRSEAYLTSRTIEKLKVKYSIQSTSFQYVAGTMFCVRAALFEDFFRVHLPLSIRETLEHGNVTDNDGPTITHCWERLLCWLVTSQGYQIKGV